MMNSKKDNDISTLRLKDDNNKCFDCSAKGTTYVVLDFYTFVCSNCAGVHRELGYKVKGIGLSSFTLQELKSLNKIGNKVANLIWMSKFDNSTHKIPSSKDFVLFKHFINRKYKEKKFYSKTALKKYTEADKDSSDENKFEKNGKLKEQNVKDLTQKKVPSISLKPLNSSKITENSKCKEKQTEIKQDEVNVESGVLDDLEFVEVEDSHTPISNTWENIWQKPKEEDNYKEVELINNNDNDLEFYEVEDKIQNEKKEMNEKKQNEKGDPLFDLLEINFSENFSENIKEKENKNKENEVPVYQMSIDAKNEVENIESQFNTENLFGSNKITEFDENKVIESNENPEIVQNAEKLPSNSNKEIEKSITSESLKTENTTSQSYNPQIEEMAKSMNLSPEKLMEMFNMMKGMNLSSN